MKKLSLWKRIFFEKVPQREETGFFLPPYLLYCIQADVHRMYDVWGPYLCRMYCTQTLPSADKDRVCSCQLRVLFLLSLDFAARYGL